MGYHSTAAEHTTDPTQKRRHTKLAAMEAKVEAHRASGSGLSTAHALVLPMLSGLSAANAAAELADPVRVSVLTWAQIVIAYRRDRRWAPDVARRDREHIRDNPTRSPADLGVDLAQR